jgi:hypothetical protein
MWVCFPVNDAPRKLASLTGFAPVISCMRGRNVGRATHRHKMVRLTSPLLISYIPKNWSG